MLSEARAFEYPPAFFLGRDIINDTATARYGNLELQNEATFTVSARNPAEAVLQSQGEFCCNYNDKRIVSRANCLTKSDTTAIHHSVDLVVTIDGEEFFRKKWDESVPRDFF